MSEIKAFELSSLEKEELKERALFTLEKNNFKMAYVIAFLNILFASIIFTFLLRSISQNILTTWYSAILILNILTLLWVFHAQSLKKVTEIHAHNLVLIMLFGAICLIWGIMPFFFSGSDLSYQPYLLTSLFIVLLTFTIFAYADFALALTCILCLVVPSLFFYSYAPLSKPVSVYILIFGLLSISMVSISSKLSKGFFYLRFMNEYLKSKLEDLSSLAMQNLDSINVKPAINPLGESEDVGTYQSTHDLLTNLPNQQLLQKFLEDSIKSANQKGHMFALIFYSINELDEIYNDYGFQVGDDVSKKVAERFRETYGESFINLSQNPLYTITHFRKNVFAIILQPIFDVEKIDSLTDPLFALLKQPIYTEKEIFELSACVGISIYPRNGRDIDSLLKNADDAMLQARKKSGNSKKLYKSEITAEISQKIELENKLKTSLEQTEFFLQYQPIIELKTGFIVGMEALIRWENPSLGRVSPADFIPLAEASGLIVPLTDWVLRKTLIQTKKWHELGFTSLRTSINFSINQLKNETIIQSIQEIIEFTNFDPRYLEIELNANSIVSDPVFSVIQEIKQLGIGISIDNFGSDHTNRRELGHLQIDRIKIDKSVVAGLENEKNKEILREAVAFAKEIKATSVAVGVETTEQFEFLLENHCDMAQGFYFSPAVNPETLTKMLTSKVQFIK